MKEEKRVGGDGLKRIKEMISPSLFFSRRIIAKA
jgi:hypothetical protein